MARVLILADREKANALANALAGLGHNSTISMDWDGALALLEEQPVDLILLAPGLVSSQESREGLRRLREIRDIPVLALISEEAFRVGDQVREYSDFVLEPFRTPELVARLRRLLSPGRESQNLVAQGDLVIDRDKYKVYVGGRPVSLTFKEFELLSFLASRSGKVFSRETLLNQVWGYDYFGGVRTVDVHVRRLRSKIEDRKHIFIETVRNVGYRFKS